MKLEIITRGRMVIEIKHERPVCTGLDNKENISRLNCLQDCDGPSKDRM